MRIIDGDILNVKHGIICHQINCQHKMGAGLAAQIRHKYPKHYADFMSAVPHLGGLCITQINWDLYVVGIYAQDYYGRTGLFTQYPALEKGLQAVARMSEKQHLPVYIPYGIGCGLAGGDWRIVSGIITKTLPNSIIVKK